MAGIVNLRTARKHKLRAEKEKQAQQNRDKFGQPKALKHGRDAQKALENQRLDGHKRQEQISNTLGVPDATVAIGGRPRLDGPPRS